MDWGYVAGYFDGEGTVEFYDSKTRGAHCKRCGLQWCNTDRASLAAIRDFIGAGVLKARARRGVGKNGPHKVGYVLIVARRQDTIRVGRAMLGHCIIKRARLVEMLEWVEHEVKDRAEGWGSLGAAGPEEVRRLYHDLDWSQAKIAGHFGVSQPAVKNFMQRHGVPTRSRAEASRLADRSTPAWQERNRKVSEIKKAQWADPEWRARQVESMRRK